MGNAFSFLSPSSSPFLSIFNICCSKKTYQIRVAGPAQAGKTSIIKWLKHRKFIKLPPTEGLEVDRVEYKDCALVMWDSRQHFEDTVRPHHLDIRGVAYVVDSADPGRLRIANRTLDRLLRDLPDAAVLLVLATKQDKPGALSVSDIQTQLQLHDVLDKECGVFACSSKTGEGIEEGIDWMCRQLALQSGHGCVSCTGGATLSSLASMYQAPSAQGASAYWTSSPSTSPSAAPSASVHMHQSQAHRGLASPT